MSIKKIKQMILMMLPVCVVGCTQGQESFSTEPGKGYGWKDMTETQAEIHKEIKPETKEEGKMNLMLPAMPVAYPMLSSDTHLSSVTRMPEHYMRIWFAPYQDHLGNLHEECAVHTVMQTGRWIVPKVQDTLTA